MAILIAMRKSNPSNESTPESPAVAVKAPRVRKGKKRPKLFETKEITVSKKELPEKTSRKPVRDASFKEYMLPEHLRGLPYKDQAVKAYIKEMLLEFKTEIEIATIITELTGEKRVRAQMLISAAKIEMEIEFSKKSKDAILGFLEAAIFKGMAVCYKEKDMSSYMRGCALLKEIYGVEKKIRATIEPSNPYQVFGDTFITLKDRQRTEEYLEAEVVGDDSDSGE